MNYVQVTDAEQREMLAACGAETVGQLFAPVPPEFRLNRDLAIPPGLSEPELIADLNRLQRRNTTSHDAVCFLGAGAYDHYIPTLVDSLAMQSEFVTAYTPYQAEASQGSLQAFFEFQSMICELTGLDVANASVYEGATATVEAIIMCRAASGKRRVLISSSVHPDYRAVIATHLRDQPVDVVPVPMNAGVTDLAQLEHQLNADTAAVVLQSPNFFGVVEDVAAASTLSHRLAADVIAVVDPISLGVLASPGACGADVAVGDGQPLGVPMQFGGPSLGFFAAREKFMRKMPGRLIGQTVDADGNRAFCLTLQTREQHIRREKATSNICTNQGLLAMRAAVYMATVGKQGLATIAQQCLAKSHYLAGEIAKLPGYRLRFTQPFFKEFVVACDKPVERVLAVAREAGIHAGVPLGRRTTGDAASVPADLDNCLMIAVTEKRTRPELDRLVEVLRSV